MRKMKNWEEYADEHREVNGLIDELSNMCVTNKYLNQKL